MSWSPNRQFLRDCRLLSERGHTLTYARDHGYKFQLDGDDINLQGIADAAKFYRNWKPLTEQQMAEINAQAEELAKLLNFK